MLVRTGVGNDPPGRDGAMTQGPKKTLVPYASLLRRVLDLRERARDPLVGLVNGLVEKYGLGELVTVREPVNYEQAVNEMLTADGLLILQSDDCNHQIPAKIYEYMRAQKPILALTDPAGDTAGILRQSGANELFIARLDSADEIETELQKFIAGLGNSESGILYPAADSFSRRSQVGTLAGVFDELSNA